MGAALIGALVETNRPPNGTGPQHQVFYRPELDALRFLAFCMVLVHHGPASGGVQRLLRQTGGFGLSLFFVLSAYLITSLLLTEAGRTGGISWKKFVVRRALRIWPLYFGFLGVAWIIPQLVPRVPALSVRSVAIMSVFLANWVPGAPVQNPLVGALWSISVEEQFYLAWPPVLRWFDRSAAVVVCLMSLTLGFWSIAAFRALGWTLWYFTPVEFIFFACGSLLAILLAGRFHVIRVGRIIILTAGFAALVFAASCGVGSAGVGGLTLAHLEGGYFAAACGCSAILVGTLGLQGTPRWLAYLGKISYGLYVFHGGAMFMVQSLIPRGGMIGTDAVVLAVCVAAAHLSYQCFERPFLKLKRRFELIESRPI